MPRFEMPLGDVQAETTAPEGMHDVRIFSAQEIGCSKEELADEGVASRISIGVAVEDTPGIKPINHALWIPKPNHDEKQRTDRMRSIRNFFAAFSVPFDADGFTTEDLVGATATVRLKLSTYTPKGSDDEIEQNRLVIPTEERDDKAA